MKKSEDPWKRFTAKCRASYNSTCIEWVGALSVGGYGIFKIKKRANFWRNVYAHRFSYERNVKDIPKGMYIDHICRNRKCVYPEHLRIVTPQQNATCKRGHEFTKENTMIFTFPSQSRRQCGICYDMAQKIRMASWRIIE